MSYWHPVWSRDAPVEVVCCLSWTVWSVFLSWTAMKAKPKGGFRFFQSASFAVYFFSKCIFCHLFFLKVHLFRDQDVACSQQRCNWCSRILCRENWIWVQKEELGGSSAFLVFLIFSYSFFFWISRNLLFLWLHLLRDQAVAVAGSKNWTGEEEL